MDGETDPAPLLPAHLVGARSLAQQGPIGEVAVGDPPELAASRAGQVGEVLGGLVGELEVVLGEAIPGLGAEGEGDDGGEGGGEDGDPSQQRLVSREPHHRQGHPSLPPLQPAQRREAQQGAGDGQDEDRQHLMALVGRRRAVEPVLQGRAGLDGDHSRRRRHQGDQQRRPQPEAIARECQQRDRANRQGEHPPARVGEVEAEQRNRDRRHGGEAEQRRGGAAAGPEQQRDRDREHRPVRVPVAERVGQPRPPLGRLADVDDVGQEPAGHRHARRSSSPRSPGPRRSAGVARGSG